MEYRCPARASNPGFLAAHKGANVIQSGGIKVLSAGIKNAPTRRQRDVRFPRDEVRRFIDIRGTMRITILIGSLMLLASLVYEIIVFSSAYAQQIFIVCHGEFENTCKQHPYTVFEHCGDDNGVGGANPNLSARNLCG